MEIDELVWQYNKERAIEALYDDKMCMVESFPATGKEAITVQNNGEKTNV